MEYSQSWLPSDTHTKMDSAALESCHVRKCRTCHYLLLEPAQTTFYLVPGCTAANDMPTLLAQHYKLYKDCQQHLQSSLSVTKYTARSNRCCITAVYKDTGDLQHSASAEEVCQLQIYQHTELVLLAADPVLSSSSSQFFPNVSLLNLLSMLMPTCSQSARFNRTW